MSIRIGNAEINKISVGNNLVSKMYVGEQRILPDTPIDTYVDNIVSLGGNEETVKQGYSNVPYSIKDKASVILFPSHVDKYRIYAMDNNTGGVLPVYFSRNSRATLYDSDLNMQLVENNIPRIDYTNYSNDVKLLIEKESTNLLLDSTFELDSGKSGANYVLNDSNWLNFIPKIATIKKGSNNAIGYYYKVYTENNPLSNYTMSSLLYSEGYPKINAQQSDNMGSNTGNGWSTLGQTAVRLIKDNIWLVNRYPQSSTTVGAKNIGWVKYSSQSDTLPLEVAAYQLESGNIATSYIPTTDSIATRSADIMKINLLKDCQVYIKTTKEEKYLDKTAGVWNVQDDITESDGLLVLAIMENGAFDTTYFNSQFVEGSPVMTSNTAPSPYVVYTENVYSSNAAYAVWNALSDVRSTGWITKIGTFEASTGSVTGIIPYLWLDLGNSTNAKQFCKVDIKRNDPTGLYSNTPKAITIGYSNDNITYTYYPRFTDLTTDKWISKSGIMSLYFEPPATPQRYWSLSVVESNPNTNGISEIDRLTFYTDINNDR